MRADFQNQSGAEETAMASTKCTEDAGAEKESLKKKKGRCALEKDEEKQKKQNALAVEFLDQRCGMIFFYL